MRLRINIVISLLALATIIGGVRFAVAQERRRTPEFLQGEYRQLNEKFFAGSLPRANISWADLTHEEYAGETYQDGDGSFVILLDRESNFANSDLQDTTLHEMCHVATWDQEQDPHGLMFQACMARVKAESK